MDNTFSQIYRIVSMIPAGKVCTYGQIANALGKPHLSRIVGYALHSSPEHVPCHRVVNRFGDLSDAFKPCGRSTHRMLLELEGIGFTGSGCVDLRLYQWQEL